jgi:extracellular elastinolytic metalloproteinase
MTRLLALSFSAVLINALPPPSPKPLIKKKGSDGRPFFHKAAIVNQKTTSQANQKPPKDIVSAALKTILTDFGIPEQDLELKSVDSDSKFAHVYFRQMEGGVAFENHNCAVHFAGKEASSSLCTKRSSKKPLTTKCSLSLDECVAVAEDKLQAKRDSIPETMRLYELPNLEKIAIYSFQIRNDTTGSFRHVSVDCNTRQIVDVVDYGQHWTTKMSYTAIRVPNFTPMQGISRVDFPENNIASPEGWNVLNGNPRGVTEGNNGVSVAQVIQNGQPAYMYANIDPGFQQNGNDLSGSFSGTWDSAQHPTSPNNARIATINVFYVMNKFHDIMYQYGFTESAGNFQENNYGRGGIGNDGIVAIVQDRSSVNNAWFATPPDGQRPQMRLFLWNTASPPRDGALSNDITLHELAHGLSNRLTGGKADGRCLQNMESMSLGEGWSDAIAMFLLRKATDTRKSDFGMGTYALNQSPAGVGVRRFKYSTNLATSPLKYSQAYLDVHQSQIPHLGGEVWANCLNEMYWNLVDLLGYGQDWYDANQLKGNVVALRLVVEGMKRQPCNPTFLQARNAIIQANQDVYGGKYKCQIWAAFAKRGLGTNARDLLATRQQESVPTASKAKTLDSSNVPIECLHIKPCNGRDGTLCSAFQVKKTPPPLKPKK